MQVDVTIGRSYPEVISGLWNAEPYYAVHQNEPIDAAAPDYCIYWGSTENLPDNHGKLSQGMAKIFGKIIIPKITALDEELTRLTYTDPLLVDLQLLIDIEQGGVCRDREGYLPMSLLGAVRQAQSFERYLANVDPVGMQIRMYRAGQLRVSPEAINKDIIRFRDYAKWLLSIEGAIDTSPGIFNAAEYESLE